MPLYEYTCPKCGHEFESIVPFSASDTPQPCPVCGEEAEKMLSQCSFILKGDGWTGKAFKIKGQMAQKNKRLDAKQKELPSTVTLAPNVEGERVDTWSEAKKLAASKGKVADTYDPMIRKERGKI